jgi:hypothetical protein
VAITQIATVTSQAILDSGTGRLFSPTAHEPCPVARVMTAEPALTPSLALDYLRELSADVRSGVILAIDGEHLAGPEALVEPARDLLKAAGEAAEIHVSTADGAVYAARSDRHAIAVVCGRFALPSLIRYDLRLVLSDLGGGERPEAA